MNTAQIGENAAQIEENTAQIEENTAQIFYYDLRKLLFLLDLNIRKNLSVLLL